MRIMIQPDFSLAGRTALITGSTQGLGLAIAEAYAVGGARVIINGRDRQRVDASVARLKANGLDAFPMVCDIGRLETQKAAFDAVSEAAGPPDILVNNVGIRIRKSLANFSLTEINELVRVNLVAALQLSQFAAQSMVKHKQQGRLLAMTSIAGELARPGDAVYPVVKHGMTGMVRALAVEYGKQGITSNGIAPGTFHTETNAQLAGDPQASALVIGRNPLQRWGRPDEITGAAVFLASAAASYVNGHILVVDGGYSIAF